jgi:hypothetical protein
MNKCHNAVTIAMAAETEHSLLCWENFQIFVVVPAMLTL